MDVQTDCNVPGLRIEDDNAEDPGSNRYMAVTGTQRRQEKRMRRIK
jgi:hypothetical protein